MKRYDYTLGVVIPCWNCVPYIGEMLDCLLSQTFTDWKVFVVDDWCTDGTTEVVKKYAAKDARINYYKRDRGPKGAQTCRNIGFDLSKGAEYVIFFDADDLIAPFCFEQRVKYMNAHHEISMGIFPATAFKEKGMMENEKVVYGLPFIKDDIEAFLNWNLPFIVCTNIFRRDTYVSLGLVWDEKVLSMQDSFFNISAIASGIVYKYADNAKFDYFYRIGQIGLAKKIKTNEHFKSHLYLLNEEAGKLEHLFGHKYDFFIQNLILIFLIQVFKEDREMLRKIIGLPWVKKHFVFRVRLQLFYLLRQRGRKYLFSDYLKYSRLQQNRWLEHMKSEAEAFRSNLSVDIYGPKVIEVYEKMMSS